MKVNEIATIIQNLFNGVSNDNGTSFSFYSERKKFYTSYQTVPNAVLGNVREVSYTNAEINGVESVTALYALEILAHENDYETAYTVYKTVQAQCTGTLVSLGETYPDYSLGLTLYAWDKGDEIVTPTGNNFKITCFVSATINKDVINGSEFSFELKNTTDNKTYQLKIVSMTGGEQLASRLGNYGNDGRVRSKAQSSSCVFSASGVLLKDSFAKEVIFDGIFTGANVDKSWTLDVTGYELADNTTLSYSLPVIISIPSLNFVPKQGMVWTLTFNLA